MNVDVLGRETEIFRIFWSDSSFPAEGGGPADGDEGLIIEKSLSDTSSSDPGVTIG